MYIAHAALYYLIDLVLILIAMLLFQRFIHNAKADRTKKRIIECLALSEDILKEIKKEKHTNENKEDLEPEDDDEDLDDIIDDFLD